MKKFASVLYIAICSIRAFAVGGPSDHVDIACVAAKGIADSSILVNITPSKGHTSFLCAYENTVVTPGDLNPANTYALCGKKKNNQTQISWMTIENITKTIPSLVKGGDIKNTRKEVTCSAFGCPVQFLSGLAEDSVSVPASATASPSDQYFMLKVSSTGGLSVYPHLPCHIRGDQKHDVGYQSSPLNYEDAKNFAKHEYRTLELPAAVDASGNPIETFADVKSEKGNLNGKSLNASPVKVTAHLRSGDITADMAPGNSLNLWACSEAALAGFLGFCNTDTQLNGIINSPLLQKFVVNQKSPCSACVLLLANNGDFQNVPVIYNTLHADNKYMNNKYQELINKLEEEKRIKKVA